MGRYVVNAQPVPIYEFDPGTVMDEAGNSVPPNVIYIKSKMDLQTQGLVENELFAMNKATNGVELRIGSNKTALLKYNIVRWEGPDLSQLACTPEVIGTLDPDEPHIKKVLEEIEKRNRKTPSPDPKGHEANGSPPHGAHVSEELAVTVLDDWTQSSRSLNGGIGQSKNVTGSTRTTRKNS